MDVRLMMLSVVEVDSLLRDLGLEGVSGVGEGRKFEGHGAVVDEKKYEDLQETSKE